MTITERLSEFSRATRYEDLPAEVIEKAKLLVLDTVGVAIGSTALSFGQDALRLSNEWASTTGASLVGHATRVTPHHAALVNGILAHGQDFDDTHTESVVHSSAALVPAMLACAERDNATGREMLLAFVLGTEISLRLALPARNAFHLNGFHTTSVACTFGTALLSSLMGRRNEQAQLTQALGVAGSFASGLLECVPAASSAKRLHAGWAGLCGILADDLARSGFTGPSSVIEGHLGVYASMLRGQNFDLEEIFAEIGSRWHILDIRPKLYPCCHYLQSFIDCADRVRARREFDPNRIVRISARVAEGSVNMICKPWDIKIAPKTGYDARFSLPYAIATMLQRGRAGQVEFQEDQLGDQTILGLMQKVTYAVDPAFSVKDMPGWLELTFEDGTVVTEALAEVRGNFANPIAATEIMDKFRDCTSGFELERVDSIANQILELDMAVNVKGLMRDLADLQHRPLLGD